MLRSREMKMIFRGQFVKQHFRYFAAQAEAAADTKFQDEWMSAKSFESIPGVSRLQTLRRFLPGGKYHKLHLSDVHK